MCEIGFKINIVSFFFLVLCFIVKLECGFVVLDNDVVEDVCFVLVVDGVYDGIVVGGYVLFVLKDVVGWIVVVVFVGIVEDDFFDVKDMFVVVVFSVGVVIVK